MAGADEATANGCVPDADSGKAAGRSHYVFNIEGMHCANCARAVERAVGALEGVQRVTANAVTARGAVEWNPQVVTLAKIFGAVTKAGFRAVPLEGEAAFAAGQQERRSALKRIGVAGLGMMQTMMFVYALYAGGNHGVDPAIAQYLRLAGMLLTTPVLVYSGWPFLSAAFHDVRRRRLGMDVPVSIALVIAFAASVVNTLKGSGQVYYDSVTMFVFFLSIGRFAEMAVRQRRLSAGEAFVRSIPATAMRVRSDGSTERVKLSAVFPGYHLRVARGAVIPVDGDLTSAHALVDEALITGESRPVRRKIGDPVLGGSINTGDSIEMVCTASAAKSTLAGIVSLLRQAGAERPNAVAAADRAASIFSLITIVLAGSVATYWSFVDPAYAITAALAVLVVTCPCALSLATPATFAAVMARLARLGLLVVKPDAVERLATVDTVILDKTGTLTSGAPVARIEFLEAEYSADDALAIAASLERGSDHPLALAFVPYANANVQAWDLREVVGKGLEGTVAGQAWRLGRPDFVSELAPARWRSDSRTAETCFNAEVNPDVLALGNDQGLVATIRVQDDISQMARDAIVELQQHELSLAIASGDSEGAVRAAAACLGIAEYHARMDFNEKLKYVQSRQAAGAHVLMVGDGINDAPVLACAHVSCALTDGSAIAQSAADLLLLNRSLRVLAQAVALARQARRVVKQNLTWALIYNVTMVPLAAAGWISPWVAALGMSASSLAVVLNSSRLAMIRPVVRAEVSA